MANKSPLTKKEIKEIGDYAEPHTAQEIYDFAKARFGDRFQVATGKYTPSNYTAMWLTNHGFDWKKDDKKSKNVTFFGMNIEKPNKITICITENDMQKLKSKAKSKNLESEELLRIILENGVNQNE